MTIKLVKMSQKIVCHCSKCLGHKNIAKITIFRHLKNDVNSYWLDYNNNSSTNMIDPLSQLRRNITQTAQEIVTSSLFVSLEKQKAKGKYFYY